MKIKTKLTYGIGILFILILILGVVAGKYYAFQIPAGNIGRNDDLTLYILPADGVGPG